MDTNSIRGQANINYGPPKKQMTGNQQHKNWSFLLLAFAFLLSAGCGNEEPTNAVKKPLVNDKTGAHGTLRIVFKWYGDDFASRQDLAFRDKIGELIRERGVGRIIRAGTGMGWMDIFIEVKDKDIAIPKLNSIVKETGSGRYFIIEDVSAHHKKNFFALKWYPR